MPDWVISLFFAFVVLPVVGALYVAFVHWLGSRVIRLVPLSIARILAVKVSTNWQDLSRPVDRIKLELNRKRKRDGKPVEGELLPRQKP